jgi:hypothetical protein
VTLTYVITTTKLESRDARRAQATISTRSRIGIDV